MPAVTCAPLSPLSPIHGLAHTSWETLPAKWIHQPSLRPTFSGNWECAVHRWMITQEWAHIHYWAKMFLRPHNEAPAVARALLLHYPWFKFNQKTLQDIYVAIRTCVGPMNACKVYKYRTEWNKETWLQVDLLLVSLSLSLSGLNSCGWLPPHSFSLAICLTRCAWLIMFHMSFDKFGHLKIVRVGDV